MGNSLCKAAERAMNRDGDVCNKAYIGVNITPNIRQQNQVNDDIFEMTSHVKMNGSDIRELRRCDIPEE